MRLLIVLLFSLLLGGCGEEISSHDKAYPYAFSLRVGEFNAEFAEAIAWWNAQPMAGAPMLKVASNGPSLVLFASLAPGEIARTWRFGGNFYVYFDPAYAWTLGTFCWAARHELGHVLGLPHSSDPTDIMYPYLGGNSC